MSSSMASMLRNSTTDVMCALRVLMEKYGKMEGVALVFMEITYDKAPREELRYCTRKCQRTMCGWWTTCMRTVVRYVIGVTPVFMVGLGLTFSPLFALVVRQAHENEVNENLPNANESHEKQDRICVQDYKRERSVIVKLQGELH